MAAGDLSADQSRFGAAFASATGIDATVVRAWIGAESGWGTTKGSHNYLNVGPGQVYRDTDQAAAATARLINTSANYAGIRGAIPAGPIATVKAIEASPWDAGHYAGGRLGKIYAQLADVPGPGQDGAADATLASFAGIPSPGDAAGAVVDIVTGRIGKLFGLDKLASEFLIVGLGLVFTLGALGLIALGLNRLTGGGAKDVFDKAQGLLGTAQTAAKVAAL